MSIPKRTTVSTFFFKRVSLSFRRRDIDKSEKVLCALGTLPEYQGKGCASLLLESNLKDVDAQGARVFLEATPQGRPLYEKLGWESIDEMVFDLSRYGVNNVQTVTCMVRKERLDVTKS